jgi:hypothetical protein
MTECFRRCEALFFAPADLASTNWWKRFWRGSFLDELPARVLATEHTTQTHSTKGSKRLKEEYDIGLIATHRWATKSANAGWPEVAALQQTLGLGAAVWMAALAP